MCRVGRHTLKEKIQHPWVMLSKGMGVWLELVVSGGTDGSEKT